LQKAAVEKVSSLFLWLLEGEEVLEKWLFCRYYIERQGRGVEAMTAGGLRNGMPYYFEYPPWNNIQESSLTKEGG
jgi:hypothetical protein